MSFYDNITMHIRIIPNNEGTLGGSRVHYIVIRGEFKERWPRSHTPSPRNA